MLQHLAKTPRVLGVWGLTPALIALTAALALDVRAQEKSPSAIVGVWRLNKDASTPAPDQAGRGGRGAGRGGDSGGRGAGRGGGRGGVGGGGGGFGRGGGRGGAGAGRGNPDDMRRQREAMRQLLEAPERLTITMTEAMVIITTGDGITTRLSTDDKSIKDASTGMERKTHWEKDKDTLASEISGTRFGKMTETYAVTGDGELVVTLTRKGGKSDDAPVVRRFYDRDTP